MDVDGLVGDAGDYRTGVGQRSSDTLDARGFGDSRADDSWIG